MRTAYGPWKHAVYSHWSERLFFCGCWGQYIFFLPFKTCSVELALAKDITTNTIWHCELRQSGKLMKWIENAKGIMYVLKERKQKRENKERNSSSVVSTLLINGNFLFIESKLHCRCLWNGFRAIGCDKWEFI